MVTFRRVAHLVLAHADDPLSTESVANRFHMAEKPAIEALRELKRFGLVSSWRGKSGEQHWEPRPGVTADTIDALHAWADRPLEFSEVPRTAPAKRSPGSRGIARKRATRKNDHEESKQDEPEDSDGEQPATAPASPPPGTPDYPVLVPSSVFRAELPKFLERARAGDVILIDDPGCEPLVLSRAVRVRKQKRRR